jgi:CRISPR-associated protein Csy2
MKTPNGLLIFPKFRVQNANAISGPLSWGFPAITAILGAVHALSRQCPGDIELSGVGVICHDYDAQTYQPNPWEQRFRLTRNPINADGSTAAIVEEGRIHLTMSLVIGVYGEDWYGSEQQLAQELFQKFCAQRLAGGSIISPPVGAKLEEWLPSDKFSYQHLRRLLPGFALIGRPDLLPDHNLSTFLDFCSLEIAAQETPEGKVSWETQTKAGWFVPIPIGFTAISPLYPPGTVKNVRDPAIPAQFVENAYSIGEWRSPHRFSDISELFWYQHYDADHDLYLCTNNKEFTR